MTDDIVFSQQGMAFTSESVTVMRAWVEVLRHDNQMAVWSVAFDSKGEPIIALCGDYSANAAHPLALADQVEDVAFYWHADPPGLDLVRNHCIDIGQGRKSRLIDLPASK
jgi:hypothetical protein